MAYAERKAFQDSLQKAHETAKINRAKAEVKKAAPKRKKKKKKEE